MYTLNIIYIYLYIYGIYVCIPPRLVRPRLDIISAVERHSKPTEKQASHMIPT